MDIKKLISQMTVEEKIGQLVQLDTNYFGSTDSSATGPFSDLWLSPDEISTLGSVLLYSEGADSVREIQEKFLKSNRNKIPLVFMMDVIHGYKTIYPIPLALGASFDPELVAECTKTASKEATSDRVNVTFAPMVDYVRDARWGRVMESCGEDPYLNGIMGATQVKALQGDDLSDHENMAACVKHFAAYGACEGGRDYNTVELSERAMRSYYLPAYKACIDAGAAMVMPSFNSLNGVPAVANKPLIQDILRKEWGFDGVIISDYAAIRELINHCVAKDMREAAHLAFSNSCDIEMMTGSYIKNLKQMVEDGIFSEEQLDGAVERILKLKDDLGLFDDPYRSSSNRCLTKESRDIARRAAEESAVLLKNSGVLPFSKDVKKIALIGPFADSGHILGPWSCRGKASEAVTVKEGIAKLLPDAEITVAVGCGNKFDDFDRSGFDEAIKAAKAADAVVVCIGEPENYSGEAASRANINITGVQEELARLVIEANKNTAVLLFNGRPLVLTELSKYAPAILDMFFPGTEGGNAAARLLFGDANPCGKISMSFPKDIGQCPIYYNHYNTGRPKVLADDVHQPYISGYLDCGNLPLYPFGYGLSYTDFKYESLTLDKEKIGKDEEITVSITVKNCGKRKGKEVVQLYLRDLVSSACRPVAELIGFEKTELAPNENKTIVFKVNEPMLRFYDQNCNFISEKGEFTLSTGCADNLILTQKFELV